MRSKHPKCIRKIYDAFLFSTVYSKPSDWFHAMWCTAIVGLFISYTGVIYPQNTYIRCDDPQISNDFRKDTISVPMLLLVSLLGPLTIMIIFEWIHYLRVPNSRPFLKGLKRAYSFFLSLFVGNLFTFFVVEILKTAVSEPRPHFMNSCSPNLTKEVCKYQWIHITWENCSNPMNLPHRKLIDTMKSFPSGHASISIFSALFITMYFQERVKVPWSKLLSPWLHLVCWVWALLCCASRVWDSKHHWWDVVFGGILGAIAAYFTVKCMCNTFREPSKENSFPDVKFSKEKENGSSGEKAYYVKSDEEISETCAHHTSTEPIVKRLFEA